jgi:ubiquinone biosynthesis protein COQ9
MSKEDLTQIRDEVIEQALQEAAFDGWSLRTFQNAAETAGYTRHMVTAAFPGGVDEAMDHLADYADRKMLEALRLTNPEDLRVRDRIRTAALTRLEILNPHKEAIRQAVSYYAIPPRHFRAARLVWRTADRIWNWAGDTATDYNYYTKRGLLSGVLTSTSLAWLSDDDPEMAETTQFLDRRIDNVLKLGGTIGRTIATLADKTPGPLKRNGT